VLATVATGLLLLRTVVVLVFVICFVGTMQGTIGPLVWLMLSEILPLRLRGVGTGVTVLVLSMSNFAVSLSFPVLVASVGISTTFFVFAVLNVGSLVFAATRVPETLGRSLEQLGGDLRG
jgi:hypothetical protein